LKPGAFPATLNQAKGAPSLASLHKTMHLHHRHTGLLRGLILTLALAAWPAAALAQVTEVLVVPTGSGKTLVPSVLVAQSLVKRLNSGENRGRARLDYPLPPLAPVTRKERKRAARLLIRGRKAFKMMDHVRAKAALGKAIKMYKSQMKRGDPPDRYVSCLRLMGAIYLDEEKPRKAAKYVNDASLFDPLPPDPKTFGKEEVRLHQRVMAEAAMGTVVFKGESPALVWFNDRLRGLSRGKLKVRAGLYLVRIYKPGYLMRQRWFRVHAHRSRELEATLNEDNSPEPPDLVALRKEAAAGKPGPVMQRLALQRAVTQVIVVSAEQGCTPKRCPVKLSWAREDKWSRRKEAVLVNEDPRPLAKAFVPPPRKPRATAMGAKLGKGKGRPFSAAGSLDPFAVGSANVLGRGSERSCKRDLECGVKETCEEGRCRRVTPVTRRWWFWTLVGVAVVGATVGIAVPLSQPHNPVIELR